MYSRGSIATANANWEASRRAHRPAFLNNYLRNLDPAKSFFFQADINEFETHKARFDDYLAKGDLKVPFEIFNTYRQRLTTRLEAVIAELESDDLSFDFDQDEVLITDWDKAEWPKDKKTAIFALAHRDNSVRGLKLPLLVGRARR